MENLPNMDEIENEYDVTEPESPPSEDEMENTPTTIDMESILTSIKKLIGYDEEVTQFDQDFIIHINTHLATLRQIGIGPSNGFVIKDASAKWSDFLGDTILLETVKTYVYLKTRLVFDPPSNSFVIDSINKIINECEWRLNATAEIRGEEIQNGV